MTAACKEGKLYPLAANCVALTDEIPTTKSIGDRASKFFQNIFKPGSTGITGTEGISTTIDKTNWPLIGLVILAVVIGLFIIKTTSPKGKKKFSLKKLFKR